MLTKFGVESLLGLLVIFTFDFFIGTCNITQPPQSVVVLENASAVFTCGSDCDSVTWYVNDELYSNDDCGVWSPMVYTSIDMSYGLTLEEAKESCNNSKVTCVTGHTGDKVNSSAILIIQG